MRPVKDEQRLWLRDSEDQLACPLGLLEPWLLAGLAEAHRSQPTPSAAREAVARRRPVPIAVSKPGSEMQLSAHGACWE